MNSESDLYMPTVVLLQRQCHRRTEAEVRQLVGARFGPTAESSVEKYCSTNHMEYMWWRIGNVPCNLGTSDAPYPEPALSNGNSLRDVLPWAMNQPRHIDAWRQHRAFTYVDALTNRGDIDPAPYYAIVMQLAAWLVDENCILLWYANRGTGCTVFPTLEAIESLKSGRWPDG